jgi:hypothetical protein
VSSSSASAPRAPRPDRLEGWAALSPRHVVERFSARLSGTRAAEALPVLALNGYRARPARLALRS